MCVERISCTSLQTLKNTSFHCLLEIRNLTSDGPISTSEAGSPTMLSTEASTRDFPLTTDASAAQSLASTSAFTAFPESRPPSTGPPSPIDTPSGSVPATTSSSIPASIQPVSSPLEELSPANHLVPSHVNTPSASTPTPMPLVEQVDASAHEAGQKFAPVHLGTDSPAMNSSTGDSQPAVSNVTELPESVVSLVILIVVVLAIVMVMCAIYTRRHELSDKVIRCLSRGGQAAKRPLLSDDTFMNR